VTPRRVSQRAAVEQIRDAAAARPDETLWIGVDGPGGSGKSTFAARVAAAIGRAVVVAVDDFSGPDVQEWDWQRFRDQLVQPLLADRPGRYQRWDWSADTPVGWYDVPAGSVVVVEGVSSTRSETQVPWTLQVWVETPRHVRLERALARDGTDMMTRWLEHWIPSEEAYIARERPQERVDLIVPGTE
jgi:uridine kinase